MKANIDIRYSFVGQPIINLTVEPKIGVSQFDIRVLPIVIKELFLTENNVKSLGENIDHRFDK